jgi:hypothetical protein
MTTPEYRALCAELLQPLAEYDSANPYHEHRALIARARTALAQPEPEGPTNKEIDDLASELLDGDRSSVRDFARAALTRWGRPAIKPIPVGDVRYEFIVSDAETDEPQASGEASTLEEAQREGRHYLAMYEEDGPMRLELRRVEVLPHHALPVPEVTP